MNHTAVTLDYLTRAAEAWEVVEDEWAKDKANSARCRLAYSRSKHYTRMAEVYALLGRGTAGGDLAAGLAAAHEVINDLGEGVDPANQGPHGVLRRPVLSGEFGEVLTQGSDTGVGLGGVAHAADSTAQNWVIAENVGRLGFRNRMTWNQVADATGITRTRMRRLSNGAAWLSTEIGAVSVYFGVTPEQITIGQIAFDLGRLS